MALLTTLLKGVTVADDNTILKIKEDAVSSPRDTFIKSVKKQIALVKYDIKPEGEEPKGRKWYKVEDKNAYTFVRYATKRVKILPDQGPNKGALRVGTTHNSLIKFYDGLIKVAESGELDEVLNQISKDISEERAGTKKKKDEKEKQAKMDLESS